MLGKLQSGLRNIRVSCEFSVNESRVYLLNMSLNKDTHKTRLYIDRLIKVLCPKACINLTPRSIGSVFANSVFTVTL